MIELSTARTDYERVVADDDQRDEWRFTLQVFQPDVVADEHVDRARERLVERGKAGDLPLLGEVRLETVDEGPFGQTLHVGPFEGVERRVGRFCGGENRR